MCDIDSPTFQAMDDIGYCFYFARNDPSWKEKVLQNIKTNDALSRVCNRLPNDIENTLRYLLSITALWEIPYNGDSDEDDYNEFWRKGKDCWVKTTLEQAEPYFKGFLEWAKPNDYNRSMAALRQLILRFCQKQ